MKNSNTKIEKINEAKRRLLALEQAEEKQAFELAREVALDSHFKTRSSYLLIAAQLGMIIVTLFEIFYYAGRPEPGTDTNFFLTCLIVSIIIFLIYQLDGLIRARSNEKKLKALQHKIKKRRSSGGKLTGITVY